MIVAGMGCSSRATLPELRELLLSALAGRALDRLACPEMLAGQIGVLAREFGVPLVGVPRTQLQGVLTPSRSDRIAQGFGTGSVAEACALWVAGDGAQVITARQVSNAGRATCALAQGAGE